MLLQQMYSKDPIKLIEIVDVIKNINSCYRHNLLLESVILSLNMLV